MGGLIAYPNVGQNFVSTVLLLLKIKLSKIMIILVSIFWPNGYSLSVIKTFVKLYNFVFKLMR